MTANLHEIISYINKSRITLIGHFPSQENEKDLFIANLPIIDKYSIHTSMKSFNRSIKIQEILGETKDKYILIDLENVNSSSVEEINQYLTFSEKINNYKFIITSNIYYSLVDTALAFRSGSKFLYMSNLVLHIYNDDIHIFKNTTH